MSSKDPSNGDLPGLLKTSTADSIPIPRDILEKMYLSPPSPVKGKLRGTFANPTPLAIAALVLSTFPLGCDLMGWRGAGGSGAASIPVYIFIGGVIQVLAAVLEWVLGNTFSFVVFGVLGKSHSREE